MLMLNIFIVQSIVNTFSDNFLEIISLDEAELTQSLEVSKNIWFVKYVSFTLEK